MRTTAKAKPFLKWAGGKGQLLATYSPLLPARLQQLDDATYVEPFVGGGAMLFFMLNRFPNLRRAVIVDLNPRLVATYRAVRDEVEPLIARLTQMGDEYMAVGTSEGQKDYYMAARSRFNAGPLPAVEAAALLIFLNRTCFNGLFRVNSRGGFNVPFGRYAKPTICDAETLRADSELLQRVEILEGDFAQTMSLAEPHTFFYLDPPYRPLNATSNFNAYAKETFNDSEQTRLREFCDEISSRGSLFMLSNSDCSAYNPQDTFLDDLYASYHIERVWASRAINAKGNGRGRIKELLIRNYSNEMPLHQQALSLALTLKNSRSHDAIPHPSRV